MPLFAPFVRRHPDLTQVIVKLHLRESRVPIQIPCPTYLASLRIEGNTIVRPSEYKPMPRSFLRGFRLAARRLLIKLITACGRQQQKKERKQTQSHVGRRSIYQRFSTSPSYRCGPFVCFCHGASSLAKNSQTRGGESRRRFCPALRAVRVAQLHCLAIFRRERPCLRRSAKAAQIHLFVGSDIRKSQTHKSAICGQR